VIQGMPARTEFYDRTAAQLRQIESQGLHKHERVISSQQSARIEMAAGKSVAVGA